MVGLDRICCDRHSASRCSGALRFGHGADAGAVHGLPVGAARTHDRDSLRGRGCPRRRRFAAHARWSGAGAVDAGTVSRAAAARERTPAARLGGLVLRWATRHRPRGTRNSERARARRGNRGGPQHLVRAARRAQRPRPRLDGAGLHRRGALPAAVPRAQVPALRSDLPALSAARAARPAQPRRARRGFPRTDARCPARARLRGAVLRRLACRQGADRVGDLYLGSPRLGGLGPRRPPLGRPPRGPREHRRVLRRPAGVRRAETDAARCRTIPMTGHTEMGIKVVGVNHRTAPLDVRERFAHGAHEVPGALARVMAAGASGGVLLSTCNRTEFYLVADDEPALEAVWSLLGERLPTSGPPTGGAREYGYIARDRDAVRHLYRVSSGLDSMILGESQIQGQVREAWEASRAQAGPVLHRLFQTALHVGC